MEPLPHASFILHVNVASVRARTRDAIHVPQSGCGAEGGAVALMVELLSCHPTLSDRAPLSAYREGREDKALKYDQAL